MNFLDTFYREQADTNRRYGALVSAARAAYLVCTTTGYLSDATDAQLQAYRDAEAARVAFYRAHFLGEPTPLTVPDWMTANREHALALLTA